MNQEISITEFAKRFCHRVREHSLPVTWFLGAGCSVSSGIPAAGMLTENWARELHTMQTCGRSLKDWLVHEFPDYCFDNPAAHYAAVFARRHPAAAERQREIEQICSRGEPGYGYATFAQILSHDNLGPQVNTVLTTNFDDLIADALYLFGNRRRRPQIITHEALARYIRVRSPRPLIVKLHGDAMFDPRNLEDETLQIDRTIAENLYPILQDSALVFVGYGGNDLSICKFLDAFTRKGLSQPVFWIGKTDPCPEMKQWLSNHSVLRVSYDNFDGLMHILRGELDIGLVSEERWMNGYRRYLDDYDSFEQQIESQPAGETKSALKRGSETAKSSMNPETRYLLDSINLQQTDIAAAEANYRSGIKSFPKSVRLLNSYATFLFSKKRDPKSASKYLESALAIDPFNSRTLSDYAMIKHVSFNDYDEAEDLYNKALESDPDNVVALNNYAYFLQHARQNPEKAETLYTQALTIRPLYVQCMINYAQLLLELDRKSEAIAPLEQAMEISKNNLSDRLNTAKSDAANAKIFLLQFAHFPEKSVEAITNLKRLVGKYPLQYNRDFRYENLISQASKDGCTNVDLLRDLILVLYEQADSSILNLHPEWKDVPEQD